MIVALDGTPRRVILVSIAITSPRDAPAPLVIPHNIRLVNAQALRFSGFVGVVSICRQGLVEPMVASLVLVIAALVNPPARTALLVSVERVAHVTHAKGR